MNPQDFCYWLQGFFELKKTIDHREGASAETMQVIEDHLKLVFDKKTPDRITFHTPSTLGLFQDPDWKKKVVCEKN